MGRQRGGSSFRLGGKKRQDVFIVLRKAGNLPVFFCCGEQGAGGLAFEGNLWAQVGCYCAGQAIGYVSVVLAPDWLGRLRQRRYEERVLSGREKFRSRKEVLEQRAEAQEAQRRAKELRRAKK